ncbi:MAG TPA: PQQ-binding-like beta-propeller repeat protein [Saprospiraceae bacterium]|nr:PQQ-binding-like beta-propeller repeat protein [Saprospiraceae bacterium]
MIRIIRLLILIQFVFVFFACHPDPPDCINPPCNPNPVDTSKKVDTNIVWQFKGDSSGRYCLSMIPVLYQNKVVFSRRADSKPDMFLVIDKMTGEIEYSYIDIQSPYWKSDLSYVYNNIYVNVYWDDLIFIDLDGNKFLKKISLKNFGYQGSPRAQGYNDWIYIPVQNLSNPRHIYSCTWIRINMINYKMEEILTIEDKGSFEAGFESLAFWKNPKGEQIMFFQNRQYDFKNRERRIDLYAYNMALGKMEWQVDSFTITGNTSVFPIIVKEDRLYFQGSNEAFCFSCYDGSLIWNRYFPGEGFFLANAILAEGKYILKSESKYMFAMDEYTGKETWVNENAGTSSSNMIYHKGYVYYETGQDGLGVIRRIRVSSGQYDWTYFPSNYPKYSNASFGLSGIAIDPETDYLYSNDRIFHMCIRLPR